MTSFSISNKSIWNQEMLEKVFKGMENISFHFKKLSFHNLLGKTEISHNEFSRVKCKSEFCNQILRFPWDLEINLLQQLFLIIRDPILMLKTILRLCPNSNKMGNRTQVSKTLEEQISIPMEFRCQNLLSYQISSLLMKLIPYKRLRACLLRKTLPQQLLILHLDPLSKSWRTKRNQKKLAGSRVQNTCTCCQLPLKSIETLKGLSFKDEWSSWIDHWFAFVLKA